MAGVKQETCNLVTKDTCAVLTYAQKLVFEQAVL